MFEWSNIKRKKYELVIAAKKEGKHYKTFYGRNHRDKTRVQMPAKIFPHLKVKS